MKSNYKRIGDHIRLVDERNTGLKVKTLLGLSISKQFIPSVANIIGTDMENYKIIRKNQFACSIMQVRRDKKMPVALLKQIDEAIISQAYPVFEVIDESVLLPDYLMMWFTRSEFDREACFNAVGGVRGSLEWEDFCNMQLPIPHPDKQHEIVKEYNTIVNRIKLNEQLNQKLEETAQALYKQWFVDFEFPDENGKPYKSSGGEMEYNAEFDFEVPKNWKVKQLSNLLSYLNRGITPNYTEGDGILVINQKCVRNNKIDFTHSRIHDIKVKPIGNERLLQEYDILVNSTGTGTLGRVGLVKDNAKSMIVDTHITIVRANSETNPLFLWFNLSSRTADIENLAEGSTGQTELGRDNLGQLPIIAPKIEIQNEFEKIVKPIIAFSNTIDNEIPKLIALRDLILQKISATEKILKETA